MNGESKIELTDFFNMLCQSYGAWPSFAFKKMGNGLGRRFARLWQVKPTGTSNSGHHYVHLMETSQAYKQVRMFSYTILQGLQASAYST